LVDFDDTPAESAFRADATAFLAERQPDIVSLATNWPPRDLDDERDQQFVDAARNWQRVKSEHGFSGITWPIEHGGRELSGIEDGILTELEGMARYLSGVFAVAIGMVGPTIIEHGTDEQKRQFLPPLIRGEQVWCQLFSEPDAGSDLASLSTSAVRDGDTWVVRGQKVWTSHAHYADYGILLARSNTQEPKHRGITCFLLDMNAPGLDIRPLRQATGSAEFNEVYLDDVEIPDAMVLGPVDRGWSVAMTTLTSERVSIGGGMPAFQPDRVFDLARRQSEVHADGGTADGSGSIRSPQTRQELAAFYTRDRIITWLSYRVRTAMSHGTPVGAESSVIKLAMSQHLAETSDLGLALQGPAGMLDLDDAVDHATWQGHFLYQWASRLGGGTDQIQRNIIGERVLGLPR
jgi:alkylation response protein AidB-like acyl-CoA dehydrogenase